MSINPKTHTDGPFLSRHAPAFDESPTRYRMAKRTERSRFRIGDLLVHPDRNVVVRDGEDIRLEPMWMQVLVYLAEHHGRTISTQELLDEAWAGMARDEGAVQKAISMLRGKVFLEDSRHPRHVENIRGRGYRLIAPVVFPDDYVSSRGDSGHWSGGNPYVGLVAFDEAHAGVFCGRGDAIERVVNAMRAQLDNGRRFVLLVGASGSGKSSLLRAGVIPKLVPNGGENGLQALSVVHCDLGTTPDEDALGALAGAIAGWTLGGRPVFAPQPVESLRAFLTGPRESIHAAIDEAFRRFAPRAEAEPHAHLLLTLDHAEGLVAADIAGPARHDDFVRALETLCEHARVMATMIVRGDFYPKLMDAMPALIERKGSAGHVDVARPTAIEINDIITLPALRAGLGFERDPDTRATHYLNETLAEAARGQADVLPLLQHTLHELYKRCADDKVLGYAAYRDIGELEGAIARRAEEVFESLPQEAQASLEAVLGQLVVVDPESGAISSRKAPVAPLPQAAGALVQAFVEARLFATESRNGHAHYGVAHEALLRQWRRASEWVKENLRLLQTINRVENAARRWQDEGRGDDQLLNTGRPLSEATEAAGRMPEKIDAGIAEYIRASERKRRRLARTRRLLIAILSTLTAASIVLALLSFAATSKAERNRQDTIDIMGYMLVTLADELRPSASMKPLASISSRAIGLLERKPVRSMTIDELINYSRALRTLGEVKSSQGNDADAMGLFAKANGIAAASVAREGAGDASLFELAQTEYWIGYQHLKNGDKDSALKHWKRYRAVAADLGHEGDQDPAWEMEKALSASNLATQTINQADCSSMLPVIEYWTGRMRNALSAFGQPRPNWEYDEIVTASWATRCRQEHGETMRAVAEYRAQVAGLERLIALHPDAIEWRHQLASLLHFQSVAEKQRGDLQAAESAIARSIYQGRIVTSVATNNESWKRDLANALVRGGEIARLRGDRDTAASRLAEAIAIARRSRDRERLFPRIEGLALMNLSMIQGPQTSRRILDTAIDILRKLHDRDPDNKYNALALAQALLVEHRGDRAAGRSAKADRDAREAYALIRPFVPGSRDPDFLNTLHEAEQRSPDLAFGRAQ
ncbi:MAG: nSTAND1 domain-containing NTPase [Lysobacteraceae bacterium]